MSLDWLTARPIAHRGLHDAQRGIIENTATAFAAAISGSYGIETDLQISADGEAMVHHDGALGRLTEGTGRLAELSAAQLKTVQFKATADRILTLGELLDLVAGRATLLLELKSHFAGDGRLLARVADVLSPIAGPPRLCPLTPN
jgi:glycerophosphoryl diester phosphodiesterase